MPGSGGSYVYLRDGFRSRSFGRFMAFLFIWQFLLSGPLEIASGYIGFKQYASYLWPNMANGAAGAALVLGIGLLAVVLLYRQISSIGRITVSLWAGTLLTVVAVMLT